MALYTDKEKLTELFGYDEKGYVKISDKIIYFGDLKAWSRTSETVYKYLDVSTIYTKQNNEMSIGKFVYDNNGDLYVVSDSNNEYYYYVKSYDSESNTIIISYDTYDNIKSQKFSNSNPLGIEEISYTRNQEFDKKM